MISNNLSKNPIFEIRMKKSEEILLELWSMIKNLSGTSKIRIREGTENLRAETPYGHPGTGSSKISLHQDTL